MGKNKKISQREKTRRDKQRAAQYKKTNPIEVYMMERLLRDPLDAYRPRIEMYQLRRDTLGCKP